jgi:hypothetical protein
MTRQSFKLFARTFKGPIGSGEVRLLEHEINTWAAAETTARPELRIRRTQLAGSSIPMTGGDAPMTTITVLVNYEWED